MSFNLHIPIDDISEADLEADLRQAAKFGQLGRPNKSPVAGGTWNRFPEPKTSYKTDYSDSVAAGGFSSQSRQQDRWVMSGRGRGGTDDVGFGGHAGSLGGPGDDLNELNRGGETGGKQFSNVDLALARSEIQSSRDKLYEDKMKEGFLSDVDAADLKKPKYTNDLAEEERLTIVHKEGKGKQEIGKTKSDADVAKKYEFVNSLRQEHDKKLQAAVTTTPAQDKALLKMLSSLESLKEEREKEDGSKAALEDFAEDKKIKKYKNVKLKEVDDKEEERRPYEVKKPNQSNAGAGGTRNKPLIDLAEEEEKKKVIEGEKFEDDGLTAEENPEIHIKPKKKGIKRKKTKQGLNKGAKLNNEAVALAVAVDRQPSKNQTGQFHLVDNGKDRVDLLLTDTGGAWKHKVHGRRDIVAAGAIVMCLGLVVILVSLFALVRRRFLKSTRRRKTNMNNNRKYRNMGSASETEILRKPQKSLFPLASSDEDDDDDDDSSSLDEEIVYHQRKINRSF